MAAAVLTVLGGKPAAGPILGKHEDGLTRNFEVAGCSKKITPYVVSLESAVFITTLWMLFQMGLCRFRQGDTGGTDHNLGSCQTMTGPHTTGFGLDSHRVSTIFPGHWFGRLALHHPLDHFFSSNKISSLCGASLGRMHANAHHTETRGL